MMPFLWKDPMKTKTGKNSWYFNNYLLCKSYLSSTPKHIKTTTFQQVTGGNTLISFKENAGTFSKNSTTQGKIRISRWKKVTKAI